MSTPSTSKQARASPLLAAAGDSKATASKQIAEHGKDSGRVSPAKAEKAAVPLAESREKGTEVMYTLRLVTKLLAGTKPKDPNTISNELVDENLTRSAQPPHPQDNNEEEDEAPYPEPTPESLLAPPPPPDFKPLFTLIEDPDTGEHRHPSVHYLFSDDDQDLLTDATLSAIDQATASGEQQQAAEVEERIVVLDMAGDGKSVTAATSLSPRWQALKATVVQAPSWGDNSASSAERGLMLKISGQEATAIGASRVARARSGSVEELVRAFGERLDGLDEVIGQEVEESAAPE